MKKKRGYYNVAERNGVLDSCREVDRLTERLARRHPDRGTCEFLAGLSSLMAAVTDAYRRDLPISFFSTTQSEFQLYGETDDAYAYIE